MRLMSPASTSPFIKRCLCEFYRKPWAGSCYSFSTIWHEATETMSWNLLPLIWRFKPSRQTNLTVDVKSLRRVQAATLWFNHHCSQFDDKPVKTHSDCSYLFSCSRPCAADLARNCEWRNFRGELWTNGRPGWCVSCQATRSLQRGRGVTFY